MRPLRINVLTPLLLDVYGDHEAGLVSREELLKLTIAYKAETKFVDIVTQAKWLRLGLNMPFSDLEDPKDLAKNMTSIGRLCSVDVEISMAIHTEVPNAIALFRQSLGVCQRLAAPNPGRFDGRVAALRRGG